MSNEDLKGPEYQNTARVVSLTYLFQTNRVLKLTKISDVCIYLCLLTIQNTFRIAEEKPKRAKEHTIIKVVTKQGIWRVNLDISDDTEIAKTN